MDIFLIQNQQSTHAEQNAPCLRGIVVDLCSKVKKESESAQKALRAFLSMTPQQKWKTIVRLSLCAAASCSFAYAAYKVTEVASHYLTRGGVAVCLFGILGVAVWKQTNNIRDVQVARSGKSHMK